jgi:CubicO group peptidase (beta-lactamase class C family)
MILHRVTLGSCILAMALSAVPVAWAAPDESALGKADGYTAGDPTNFYLDRYKVGSFSGMHRILPSRPVRRGSDTLALRPGTPLAVDYRFDGTSHSLQDYLDGQRATGLLIMTGDSIRIERYQYERHGAHLFISWSMAKSITSLLIGVAAEKGLIASLDDRAETYVPQLRGSAYGRTTIRNLLRMSSGVRFIEDYGGVDDLATL